MMQDFLSKFEEKCQEMGLLGAKKVLLAVSGGLDSMVLLHALHSLGAHLHIAHCNFQLRGVESDGDAELVATEATRLGIPFEQKSFDTAGFAQYEGISIQQAARRLRYEWFAGLILVETLDILCTAHHANDNLETVLINLLRGTGIKGLAGIPPKVHSSLGDYPICRPLLGFSKEEILAYAQAYQVPWREDSSNLKDEYLRNAIRHQVVPILEEKQPSLIKTWGRTAQYLRDTEQNYRAMLDRFLPLKHYGESGYQLELEPLRQLPSPAAALRERLAPLGFTPEQARQLAANLHKVGTEVSTDDQRIRAVVDRRSLLLLFREDDAVQPTAIRIDQDDLMVKLPGVGKLFLVYELNGPLDVPDGRDTIVLRKDLLKYPLTLRTWLPGDSFQPFGMGGKHQKLQDFLTNQKLSKPEKEQTWLLANQDGTIVWVVGHRMDERFRLDPWGQNGCKFALIRQ